MAEGHQARADGITASQYEIFAKAGEAAMRAAVGHRLLAEAMQDPPAGQPGPGGWP